MAILKTLVIDSSALYRKLLRDTLSSFPDIELVGAVANTQFALERISRTELDLITFDFDMPDMEVIAAVKSFREKAPDVKIIMVSSSTKSAAKLTLRAIAEGAFGFVSKPQVKDMQEAQASLKAELLPLINTLAINKNLLSCSGRFMKESTGAKRLSASGSHQLSGSQSVTIQPQTVSRYELVVIGISTGGPSALMRMLPMLPENFPLPILLVQHMPPFFTEALADSLNKKCKIRVIEAAAGMSVSPGVVHIAPGGYQMGVARRGAGLQIRISDAPPENNCRPAADYLFRSVAENTKGPVIGVIMTGMGADGVKGLQELKKKNAWVIAQDQESSIVFGMPMEAIRAGVADIVSPLNQIAGEIVKAAYSK